MIDNARCFSPWDERVCVDDVNQLDVLVLLVDVDVALDVGLFLSMLNLL